MAATTACLVAAPSMATSPDVRSTLTLAPGAAAATARVTELAHPPQVMPATFSFNMSRSPWLQHRQYGPSHHRKVKPGGCCDFSLTFPSWEGPSMNHDIIGSFRAGRTW